MAYRTTKGKFNPKPVPNDRLVRESSGKQGPASGLSKWSSGSDNMGPLEQFLNNGLLYANGGSYNNPMGFPGYGSLYTGLYPTYRWMLQHPILRLVRSIAVGAILASRWRYEKTNKNVPDSHVDLVQRVFDNLRSSLLNDFFVRGRDYGWAGGELIWEIIRGETILTRVKPLLPDVTEILTDDYGNFTGLRNYVKPNSRHAEPYVDLPAPYKGWIYTFDSEAGYKYGRSWLENVRSTAWKDWLDTAQQMQKLGAKISGIVTIITSPAGSFPGPNGKMTSYRENALKVIEALAKGAAGAWFPSLALTPDKNGSIDAMKVLVELAGKSLVKIDTLDFGSQTPAIGGFLERMRHDEELMFAGGLRPSRTGLEGKHGTKAEAETHTDTGTTNSELDDVDFAKQCQSLVDAVLVVNKGENARGTVRIETPSLVDRTPDLLRAVLLAIFNHPELTLEMVDSIDMDWAVKFLGLKMKKPFTIDAVRKAAADKQRLLEKQAENPAPSAKDPPRSGTVEPEGGRPKEKK